MYGKKETCVWDNNAILALVCCSCVYVRAGRNLFVTSKGEPCAEVPICYVFPPGEGGKECEGGLEEVTIARLQL